MSEVNGGRRAPRKLSAEQKWEVFLQVTSKDLTQAEAARKWRVDVSTVMGIRRTVKDAALAALSRGPGRPAVERNYGLEAARDEIAALTEAVKAQAIELAVVRGKAGTQPTPRSEADDLVHFQADLRGRLRSTSEVAILTRRPRPVERLKPVDRWCCGSGAFGGTVAIEDLRWDPPTAADLEPLLLRPDTHGLWINVSATSRAPPAGAGATCPPP